MRLRVVRPPRGLTRTARTYAPLLAVSLAFTLMVAIVHPVSRPTQEVLAAGPRVAAAPGEVATGATTATTAPAGRPGSTSAGGAGPSSAGAADASRHGRAALR